MNVSDGVLNNLSSSKFSQNNSLNNVSIDNKIENLNNTSLEGFDTFIEMMQKNYLVLFFTVSILIYLQTKLNTLKSSDTLGNEREINIVHRSTIFIFLWLLVNISSFFYICVIDPTYLYISDIISMSYGFLFLSSLALAIRETIEISIKYLFDNVSTFLKKIKKLPEYISKL